MGSSRNLFLLGRGRGQGSSGPKEVLGSSKIITKNNSSPPRRPEPLKPNLAPSSPRVPPTNNKTTRKTQNSVLPPRDKLPDFSRFQIPSSVSRLLGVSNNNIPNSPSPSRGSQNSFDFEWSSSVASADIGIDERYDDHSYYEIDMDATYDEIEDVLVASYSEIHHRLVTEPVSSATEIISKHLDIVTPPNSPSLISSSPARPTTQETEATAGEDVARSDPVRQRLT
ncbi:hypothetical protein BKA65DRAFT_471689 [Rhexocercosporidium sp. MPI-PUGE-AT-0058]|nr:hypothetical protein BKA65DRAFT_471689 [Rhexocercosporidium sp. MPI-PUGE-AT-0058]